MKKITYLCLSLLVPTLLLCGCTQQPLPSAGSTGSASVSTTGTTVGQTESGAVPMETVEDVTAFIQNTTVNGQYLYTRALGCIFEKPEDIPAWFYFYLGVGENGQFTDEENAFLMDAFKKKNPNSDEMFAFSATKLPVTKINGALSVLGVTIEDIQIPDRWVYYDKTDSYYFWVTDAYGVAGWTVTEVEKGADGMLAVYWETGDLYWGDPAMKEPSQGAKMVMTLQAIPDGSYRILSNVPQQP